MLTILEVWRSIKVIGGQFRVMRVHMIPNSKHFSHIISLDDQLYFDICIVHTSCICSKLLSFEVIKGQWRSAWGQSFDLKLAETYNAAVFCFQLICNMPIFSSFSIFQFSRSKKVTRGQVMVMRGHMIKRRKKMFSQMISLGAQLSFDIHHA